MMIVTVFQRFLLVVFSSLIFIFISFFGGTWSFLDWDILKKCTVHLIGQQKKRRIYINKGEKSLFAKIFIFFSFSSNDRKKFPFPSFVLLFTHFFFFIMRFGIWFGSILIRLMRIVKNILMCELLVQSVLVCNSIKCIYLFWYNIQRLTTIFCCVCVCVCVWVCVYIHSWANTFDKQRFLMQMPKNNNPTAEETVTTNLTSGYESARVLSCVRMIWIHLAWWETFLLGTCSIPFFLTPSAGAVFFSFSKLFEHQ